MSANTFHYPPELFSLMVDTIPLLCRSKRDVVLFFQGAGIGGNVLQDLDHRVKTDVKNINKYEIARTVLERLHEKGDVYLRERREVLRRVVEFENFSGCWPEDRLKGKGLVAEIREIVNVKDSFTRINQMREQEVSARQVEYLQEVEQKKRHKEELAQLKVELFALFSMTNPHERGKRLEDVLNRLFKAFNLSIYEAFSLKGVENEGTVEQIDGVVEIDGSLYLVEMKWWNKPIGKAEISPHLVNVFGRGDVKGIFISASNYTEPAVTVCRDSLSQMTLVLCLLEEFVHLLDQEGDLKAFFKEKIRAAEIHKNPLFVIRQM